MSETDRSDLGGLTERWNTIFKEWKELEISIPSVNWAQLMTIFKARKDTQATPETYVAWCLDPRTRSNTEPYDVDMVAAFIGKHCGLSTAQECYDIQLRIMQFRRGEDIFRIPIHAGDWINNPYHFWLRMSAQYPDCILVKPALRLFSCLANSVPSERSFSHQNYIHNKVRNRLDQEVVDKLTFVYYNSRALKGALGISPDYSSGEAE